MFDRDLAELYGVETKYLNRQVRRNCERFPREFMFRLTNKERNKLGDKLALVRIFETFKCPAVCIHRTWSCDALVSSSRQAGKPYNIFDHQKFVKLREIMANHKELALRLKELEMRIEKHDDAISAIFEAIRQLMLPPEKPNAGSDSMSIDRFPHDSCLSLPMKSMIS